MKNILFVSILVTTLISVACNNSESKNPENKDTTVVATSDSISPNTIQVYYFHGSIRCETCVAVDEDTHQDLKELFPNRMENGDIIFQSVNVDKDERPDLVEKYKIYGQTLLIIKGDKVIDLTEDAFMYVPTNPDKWRQIVKDNIYQLID